MADVKIERKDSVMCAYVSGEIDHHSAAEIRETIDRALIAKDINLLTMDFGGVTFMDSSGVGLILGRYKLLSALGGRLVIQGTPPSVNRMLKLAGITKIIEFKGETADETC
ncbi:MAG: anti-sigma factor antagonist [Oscillospiraceae bacterium]|nr:anti-sigma factor antagonist [Oscillospiraceae bacterium]